jgi:hypothetical protein
MKTPHLRGQAEHYRELAARFRGLANTEHLGSLRRHLRRLAAQHDELADGVAMLPSDQTPRAAIGVEPDYAAGRANTFLANQGK